MNNYNLMESEELSQDSYFRKWALGKLAKDDNFWESWQNLNPDKVFLVEEARSIVISFQAVDVENFSVEEINEGMSQILADAYSTPKRVRLSNSFWLKIAASLLIVCGIGLLVSNHEFTNKSQQEFVTAEAKRMIQVNTGMEPRSFTLKDGSKVILGPNSELQYDADFNSGSINREVHLRGEAFFDVMKVPEKPFIVFSGKLITKVIGTSFDIKAYDSDNDISVFVRTGKVMVSKQNSGHIKENSLLEEIILLPNQKAIFNKKNEFLVKTLSDQSIVPNRNHLNNEFMFEETKISDVWAVLEKAYGVHIKYNLEQMANCTITAYLGEESLYEKLDLICEIVQAKYKIINGQIVIYESGCGK